MLIRNAKDSAGKAIEVWLRDGKIAAVGLGLLVPEGEEVLDAKGRTVLPAFIDTHCHWRVHLRQPDAQHEAGLLQCRDRPRHRG